MGRDADSDADPTGDSQRALRQAHQHAEEYRRILDTASVLAAVGDFEGRFLLVNDAWRELLGYSPERLVGTEYLELVHPDDLERTSLALADLMSGASVSRTIEVRLRARDGSFRWLSCGVRADHETRRLYGSAQDITERRLMDDALRHTEERLRLLAAEVSEQIRTPMNGIVGMTSLALSTVLTAEQREYLAEVQRSAERLLDVVNQMLDITKIEVPRAIDPGPLADVYDLTEELEPAPDRSVEANRPGLGLRVLLAEDDPVNARVATRMLEKLSCTVVLAETGRSALEVLSAMHVDLVLMDLRMPDIDGLEATRTLRKREGRLGARRTPVIAVTADAMKDDQQRCGEAGMDGFLAKPITLETLEREIRRVIISV